MADPLAQPEQQTDERHRQRHPRQRERELQRPVQQLPPSQRNELTLRPPAERMRVGRHDAALSPASATEIRGRYETGPGGLRTSTQQFAAHCRCSRTGRALASTHHGKEPR